TRSEVYRGGIVPHNRVCGASLFFRIFEWKDKGHGRSVQGKCEGPVGRAGSVISRGVVSSWLCVGYRRPAVASDRWVIPVACRSEDGRWRSFGFGHGIIYGRLAWLTCESAYDTGIGTLCGLP